MAKKLGKKKGKVAKKLGKKNGVVATMDADDADDIAVFENAVAGAPKKDVMDGGVPTVVAGAPKILSRIEAAVVELVKASTELDIALGQVDDNAIVGNDFLQAAVLLDRMALHIKTTRGEFNEACLLRHEDHGYFQPGKASITFKTKAGRASTSWKEVACEKETVILASEGKVFDQKAFEAWVKKSKHCKIGVDKTEVEIK